jgi:arsenite-transporting ATPase
MRILLYAGKGGVGKTSIAAATGIVTSGNGLRTIVISLDPAHSLSDAFDLDVSLMDKNRGAPVQINDKLWIQEIDIQEEISKSWGEVHKYISILLNTSGIEDILAEELAVLPGMEEVSALLYINEYVKSAEYDLIILDCAPTAESIRFVSLPKTLEWYMKKVFHIERKLMRYMRPMAKRMTDIPLPEDEYFAAIERLFKRLNGVDQLLADPNTTSVRLVTNAEKMVLRETQRAFMFFSLHQLSVDSVIINRVFPLGFEESFVQVWKELQEQYLELAESYFHPVPLFRAPFYQTEVLGYDKLLELGRVLYGDRDPKDVFYLRRPIEFTKEGDNNVVRIHLPFVEKKEVDLTKKGEELFIRIGNFKKSIILPRTFATLEPKKARLREEYLAIDFGGDNGRV